MLCQTGVLRWSKDSQPFIVRPLVIRVAVCSHSAPRIHLRLGSCASSCADADVLSASDREAAVLPAGVEDPLRRPDPILPHRRLPSRCTSRLRLNVYLSRRRWAWWTQAGQEDLPNKCNVECWQSTRGGDRGLIAQLLLKPNTLV